jgi:hypothetical protein
MEEEPIIKPVSAGGALALLRWSKTTRAERRKVALRLNDARWAKHRKSKAKKGAAK